MYRPIVPNTLKITFEDYADDSRFYSAQIKENIEAVLRLRTEYEHQQYIESFEEAFARHNGSRYTVAVNSGTTALELALQLSGVKESDEVILPAYTYISTALAVSNIGAIPVFADIKKTTFTIDPEEIKGKITNKTKAIVPVHIHGNPCEMDMILEIARSRKLAIVEDCSHAHGAEYGGKKVGNFGMGCFSCHTSKIFSGIGNSGVITVNGLKEQEVLRRMLCVNDDPEMILSQRSPCRMDVVQAAILKAKLPFLRKVIERKRDIARCYREGLPDNIQCQREENNSKHVYRDFVILYPDPGGLKSHLAANGIETKIRYKIPLHLTQYYRNLLNDKSALQTTESIFNQLLWLPISYVLSEQEISYICNMISGYICQPTKLVLP